MPAHRYRRSAQGKATKVPKLTDREQKILTLRYGLDNGHSHSLQAVATIFNISRERVRQLEMKALEKLIYSEEPLRKFFAAELERAFHQLTKREKEILRARYGSEGEVPRSPREIALGFNITRGDVRRIEIKVLEMLKEELKKSRKLSPKLLLNEV